MRSGFFVGWRCVFRLGRLGIILRSASRRAVQSDPGLQPFLLDAEQRLFGVQHHAPRVFEFEEVTGALAITALDRLEKLLILPVRKTRVLRALVGGCVARQRIFNLVNGAARLGLEVGQRLVVL